MDEMSTYIITVAFIFRIVPNVPFADVSNVEKRVDLVDFFYERYYK